MQPNLFGPVVTIYRGSTVQLWQTLDIHTCMSLHVFGEGVENGTYQKTMGITNYLE